MVAMKKSPSLSQRLAPCLAFLLLCLLAYNYTTLSGCQHAHVTLTASSRQPAPLKLHRSARSAVQSITSFSKEPPQTAGLRTNARAWLHYALVDAAASGATECVAHKVCSLTCTNKAVQWIAAHMAVGSWQAVWLHGPKGLTWGAGAHKIHPCRPPWVSAVGLQRAMD